MPDWLNDFDLSTIDPDQLRAAFPLAIAGVFVWALWLYRCVLSALARPIVNDFRTTTSVVVPSYREDPDILMRASAAGWPRTRPRSSSSWTSTTPRC